MAGAPSDPQRRRMLAAACALCGAALSAHARGTGAGTGAGAGAMDPRVAALIAERRMLWLRRGDEEARVTYWTAAGGRDQDAYLQLCWLLRDVRADRVFAMDRGLLDTLAALQAWLRAGGSDAPMQIHSGYRTQRTNNATEGAALNSRHVVGQAADISVPGVSGVKLAGMSSLLGRGGTGFYVGRGFVHVDTGDERVWVDQKRKPAGS
jgi:uncharacterized protein YcbK (DUF882 family)